MKKKESPVSPYVSFCQAMKKNLALVECKLEDGTVVSNLDGICQVLIGRALHGDMLAIEFIDKVQSRF